MNNSTFRDVDLGLECKSDCQSEEVNCLTNCSTNSCELECAIILSQCLNDWGVVDNTLA